MSGEHETAASGDSAHELPHKPTGMRKLLFVVVLVALTSLAIEGVSCAAYSLLAETRFSKDDLRAQREAAGQTADAAPRRAGGLPSYVVNKAIHPYVGYVLDVPQSGDAADDRISSYGYLDYAPPLRSLSADRLVVGVVGGSVAMGFAHSGSVRETLQRELATVPRFANREIEWVRLALSGYRQPQQLMTVAYLLALGGKFDVIINIDGFNEVTLHPMENARLGVFYAYPRAWFPKVAELPRELTDAYRFELEARRRTADWFSKPWLDVSVTANVVWCARRQRRSGSRRRTRRRHRGTERSPLDANERRAGR